jgi:hypothetical protein
MLVGCEVVEDGVDGLADGDFSFDRVEETDQLLMAMALHVAADHGPVEDDALTKTYQRKSTTKVCATSGPSGTAQISATEASRYGLLLQVLRRIDLERQHPLKELTVRLPGRHAGEQFHRRIGERLDRV